MVTEANLKNIGWGFIEKAESAFRNNSMQVNDDIPIQLINKWRAYIKGNKEWMNGIRIVAKNRKISEDSAVTLDAIWQVQYHNN